MPNEATKWTGYAPAMEITDQAEADAWFEHAVENCLRLREEEGRPCDRAMAEDIQRQNLGYFSGYYGEEIQRRVERLFDTHHPVFGPTSEGGITAEQAFEAGKKFASGELDTDDPDVWKKVRDA